MTFIKTYIISLLSPLKWVWDILRALVSLSFIRQKSHTQPLQLKGKVFDHDK